MTSDLNLEEKANELWRGFSPKDEAEFWQAYAKCLAQAQQRRQAPAKINDASLPENMVSPPVGEAVPLSPQGKALAKSYHSTHRFYDKGKKFVRLLKKWQPGIWGTIFLSFTFTYVINVDFPWVLFVAMFVMMLSGYIKDSNVIELHSHELTIKLLNIKKPITHRFYLKDIDQISVSFNPHYDAHTLNVKTSSSEKSFSYNLSAADHQRFYEAVRAYKVYVGKWHHPSL